MFIFDELVKKSSTGWLRKKNYIRGVYVFYYFGVPGYVVMMEIFYDTIIFANDNEYFHSLIKPFFT